MLNIPVEEIQEPMPPPAPGPIKLQPQQPQPQNQQPPISQPLPHLCNVCNQSFAGQLSLRKHFRSQHGMSLLMHT